MACSTDLIGILKDDTSISGFYSRHVGINTAFASGITNVNEYNNGVAMLRDKLAEAVMIVKQEIRSYLLPYFKYHKVIDEQKCGKFEIDHGYFAATAGNHGLYIEKQKSRFSRLFVKKIRILANTSGAATITVADGNDTTTYAVTLVAGTEQDVQINYEAEHDDIYIYWDTTAISVNQSEMDAYNGTYFTCHGWDGTTTTGYTYGIVADIQCVCSDDEFFCVLSNHIALPVLYKYAELVYMEAQSTERINYFTLTGMDYEKMQNDFADKYTKAIDIVCNTIPQLLCNIDDICVSCNQTRYTETIP